jgi:hypothetical protein
VNHYICELLGIEKNKYGIASSSLDKLSHLLIMMKYEFSNSWDKAADLKQHLDDRNLYDLLKEAMFADGINYAGPSDNSVYNFVYAGYFDTDETNVTDEFIRGWAIPVQLLSSNPEYVNMRMFEIRYKQNRPIPRKVIDSWAISELDFKSKCAKYAIELLDEPIADIDPDPERDYVKGANQLK